MLRVLKAVASLVCILAVVNASRSGWVGSAGAQEGAEPTRTPRGGLLAKTGRHQFEVFFFTTGLRVFPKDRAGAPIDASRLTGTATFYHPNSPKPWFSRPLRGAAPAAAPGSESLDLAIGLGKVPPTGAKVTFEIAGLADPAESATSFTVPFEFVSSPSVASGTRPASPRGEAVPSPRYVDGPGYYGYRYYRYSGPKTAPSRSGGPTVSGYRAPIQHGEAGASVGPGHRDWSTGRDVPLAKPWLRPID